jgi:hypothetical protein
MANARNQKVDRMLVRANMLANTGEYGGWQEIEGAPRDEFG